MAYENFTTYTEVDTSGRLTVTAPKAEAVNADRDINVYLYKDKTVDYFDALDEEFEIYLASATLLSGIGGMAVTNTVGSLYGFATTDITVVIQYTASGPIYKIRLVRGRFVAFDDYTCSANTLYYCTLERAAGSDAISLKIYSDSARTNLLDTLVVAGFGTTKYRYVYGFVNYNDSTSGRDFDGYVQNLDLKEVPDPPTNVAATDGVYTNKVVITWTKSDGATGYQVYRDGTPLGWLGDVATFDDTGADAGIITPGSASASDGTSTAYVTLSLAGESVANGTTHTYKVRARTNGEESGDSGTNTGYRGVGSLTYQWQRSTLDEEP